MQIEAGQWWPICLSDNVSSTKPLGIQCADLELVAFRDAGNAVRIVEDRCPHRRAPLSLGRITPQGDIQCGYHGWTFNGESGDICGFPNLDPGERLPKCKIETYQAAELNGVVYMCMGEWVGLCVSLSLSFVYRVCHTVMMMMMTIIGVWLLFGM